MLNFVEILCLNNAVFNKQLLINYQAD